MIQQSDYVCALYDTGVISKDMHMGGNDKLLWDADYKIKIK